MQKLYVQFGCGWCAPESWLNFDASPTLRFERIPILGRWYTKNTRRFPETVRYGDIVKGLPIRAGGCVGVYCSHVLEHLALEDFRTALRHVHEYLEPGGTFRFVLPDLEALARTYLASTDSGAAARFMESSGLGKLTRARGLRGLLVEWLGGSAHRWMWDEKSMAVELNQQGFTSVRRAQFGDAEDGRFNEVEDVGRFEGCLAMQCRK